MPICFRGWFFETQCINNNPMGSNQYWACSDVIGCWTGAYMNIHHSLLGLVSHSVKKYYRCSVYLWLTVMFHHLSRQFWCQLLVLLFQWSKMMLVLSRQFCAVLSFIQFTSLWQVYLLYVLCIDNIHYECPAAVVAAIHR